MPGNSFDYEQETNNNPFFLISDYDYIPNMQTMEDQDDNELINPENHYFELEQGNNSINITNNNNYISKTPKIIKNRGRKHKGEIRQAFHTKYDEDNIIKKIKTYCMKYLNKQLNNSLNFSYKKFYKLDKKINENLRKDYNIKLMNMTIREIYEENIPNKTHSPSAKKTIYDLIQKIYDKSEDTKTIEILNTKFIDFLNKLETKEYIIKEIEKAESKDEKIDDIISYMSKVRNLFEHFENWFMKKNTRK